MATSGTTAPALPGPLVKIERVDVIVTSPDRKFVTLKLTTSDGVVGLANGTLNGCELAVVSYLGEQVEPLLVGREADNIEDTWQYLYRGLCWRRGPVTMAAIAAVDMALSDINLVSTGRRTSRRWGWRRPFTSTSLSTI